MVGALLRPSQGRMTAMAEMHKAREIARCLAHAREATLHPRVRGPPEEHAAQQQQGKKTCVVLAFSHGGSGTLTLGNVRMPSEQRWPQQLGALQVSTAAGATALGAGMALLQGTAGAWVEGCGRVPTVGCTWPASGWMWARAHLPRERALGDAPAACALRDAADA